MIATCSNCSAQFQFDNSYVKPKGTKVRCARCHEVFTVFPEQEGKEENSGMNFLLDDDFSSDQPASEKTKQDDFDFSLDSDLDDFGADKFDVDIDTEKNFSSAEPSSSPKAGQDDFDFSLDSDLDDFGADKFDMDIQTEKKAPNPDSSSKTTDLFSLDKDFEESSLQGLTSESDADLDIFSDTKGSEKSKDADSFEVDLDFGEAEETNWDDFDVDIKEDLPSVASKDVDDLDFLYEDSGESAQPKRPQKMPGLAPATPKSSSGSSDQELGEFDLDNLTMEASPPIGSLNTAKSSAAPSRLESAGLPFQTPSKADPFEGGVGAGFAKSVPGVPKATAPHAAQAAAQKKQEPADADSGTAIEGIQVKASEGAAKTPLFGQLPAAAAPKKPKLNLKKSLLSLFLFLLIATVLYCGLYFAQKSKWIALPVELVMPIELEDIPFINILFPAQKVEDIPDPGDLHIRTLNVELKFVANERLGRLLVLSGKVKNAYPHPRKHIRLRAKLFVGTETIRTRTVYAGNTIPDEKLAQWPITEIEKELNKPAGDRNSNENVAKGSDLHFMFVFGDLPANLSGYEINVISSQQAGR